MKYKIKSALEAFTIQEPFKFRVIETLVFEPGQTDNPNQVFSYGPALGNKVIYNFDKITEMDEARIVAALGKISDSLIKHSME